MYTMVMEFLVDQLKFLGLSDKEVRVFTALSTFGKMNMTKIAKRAGLARTTVDAIVRRLVEQGLVDQERVGGHQEYSVTAQKVADKLDWIERRFRPCGNADEDGVGPVEDTPIVSAENLVVEPRVAHVDTHEAMHEMVERAYVEHANERVTMLLSALVTPEKRMHRLEHCLEYARASNIKLEILTTTDVSKDLSQYAKELLAKLMAYDLRVNFLPPSFFIEYTDLIAFRDLVIVIDHHTDVAERVEGERAVLVINHLMRVAREAGWGMDMKMWLEGVLASQKQQS